MRLQLAKLRHPHSQTVATNEDGFVFRWNWAGSLNHLHSLCCILFNYILQITVPEHSMRVCVCIHTLLLPALSLSMHL